MREERDTAPKTTRKQNNFASCRACRHHKESLMDWLLTPQPGVNYNVICILQAVGSLVCVLLAVAQFILKMEMTNGWFLIFAPFLPTLFWQYNVRSRWLDNEMVATKDKNV